MWVRSYLLSGIYHFAVCLIPGLWPNTLLSALLEPVVKDEPGKVGSLDNYGPSYSTMIKVSKIIYCV